MLFFLVAWSANSSAIICAVADGSKGLDGGEVDNDCDTALVYTGVLLLALDRSINFDAISSIVLCGL